MPRTKIDFSKHELKITQFDWVLIHEFKKPDTTNHMLVFINTCGVMTVTGDFGNWVFCREFHPSASGGCVNEGYWDEKLEISSVQKSDIYDVEGTIKEIVRFKENFKDNYGRKMNEDELHWFQNLLNIADDTYGYAYVAYRETPEAIDYECIPCKQKRHFWLDVVYDGFDAICEVLRKEENPT